jgi:serine/threonine protein kinase
LAARNILLQEDWTPKVSDFGFARLVESESSARTSSDLGPIRWMAPENFGRTYSSKSDVWSWACLLLELFTKDKPYSNYELLHVGSLVREGKLSPMMWLKESKLALPTWAIEAIAACSEFDPDKRPTFSMIGSNLAARFPEVKCSRNCGMSIQL